MKSDFEHFPETCKYDHVFEIPSKAAAKQFFYIEQNFSHISGKMILVIMNQQMIGYSHYNSDSHKVPIHSHEKWKRHKQGKGH